MAGEEGGLGLATAGAAAAPAPTPLEARRPEEPVGLRLREPRDPHRLEPGRDAVGALDLRLHRRRQAPPAGRSGDAPPRPAARRARRSPARPRAFTGEIMSPITYSGASCSSAASRQRGSAPRHDPREDLLDQQRMLGHRIGMLAPRLPVPARDEGEAVGDVLDLDVERRRVEQVEPAAPRASAARPVPPSAILLPRLACRASRHRQVARRSGRDSRRSLADRQQVLDQHPRAGSAGFRCGARPVRADRRRSGKCAREEGRGRRRGTAAGTRRRRGSRASSAR